MQPTAAFALIWLVRQAAAVGRTQPNLRRAQHGADAGSAVLVSHGATDKSRGVVEVDATGRRRRRKDATGRRRKRPPDDDTLAVEVVDQATVQPVKKNFDRLDRNGNHKIDFWEYCAATRAAREVAKSRFACSDDNMDKTLSLEEFTESQDHPQELERCVSMMLAFRLVDRNQDGGISQAELWKSVGPDVGTTFDSRWAFMVACSDRNKDGKVSPLEFSKDMYGCQEDKASEAMINFANYSRVDADGSGCADQEEMTDAVNMLFGLDLIRENRTANEATRRLTRRWMQCTDFNGDRCLTEKEYEGLLDPSPKQSECIGTSYNQFEGDMEFELMDLNHNNKICRQEYYSWIVRLELEVDHEEAEALFQSADANGDGVITEEEFIGAGEAHEGDGPGYLFFKRSVELAGKKTGTAWLGSIQKTWAGLYGGMPRQQQPLNRTS